MTIGTVTPGFPAESIIVRRRPAHTRPCFNLSRAFAMLALALFAACCDSKRESISSIGGDSGAAPSSTVIEVASSTTIATTSLPLPPTVPVADLPPRVSASELAHWSATFHVFPDRSSPCAHTNAAIQRASGRWLDLLRSANMLDLSAVAEAPDGSVVAFVRAWYGRVPFYFVVIGPVSRALAFDEYASITADGPGSGAIMANVTMGGGEMRCDSVTAGPGE